MADYISREAALDCFTDWVDRYGHEHTADEMVEYQRIEDLPAADVRPVVRGRWEVKSQKIRGYSIDFYKCSVCGNEPEEKYNFCPNCGADMREAENGQAAKGWA